MSRVVYNTYTYYSSEASFYFPPALQRHIGLQKKREIYKIGYARVVSEQNRVPFFSRRGALTHVRKTPPKRVLAPEPTTPCVRAAPQTVFSVFDASKHAPMTAPKKCSPRTTRFCSETHRVYPALCFDFINHPILFILHPILFIPHPILFNFARPAKTRKRTCLLYTSPSPRDGLLSRMPSSA